MLLDKLLPIDKLLPLDKLPNYFHVPIYYDVYLLMLIYIIFVKAAREEWTAEAPNAITYYAPTKNVSK